MSNSGNAFDCFLSNNSINIPIEYERLILTYLECFGIFILISIIQFFIELKEGRKYKKEYIDGMYRTSSARISKILFVLFFV